MPTLQDIYDKRANVWSQMSELIEKDNRSGEEDQTYDRLEKEYDSLTGDIDRREKAAKLEAAHRDAPAEPTVDRRGVVPDKRDQGPDEVERREEAFADFLRHGTADMEPEKRRLLASDYVSGSEFRALASGVTTAGGYTVPPQFRNQMIEAMKTFGGMLQAAEVIHTDNGANLPWPTVDDTANVGAILAENAQVGEQDVVFGQASIDAYMYTSKLVRVSYQLAQDSGFGLEGWLARKLGERIGRILNQHFTTGTGTSQPDGIVTSATVGKQGAVGQTTTVVYDDIIDLVESIDPAYQGSASLMMHSQTRKVLRKLKDGQQRPLWEPSLTAGVPDSILGYGIRINQDMPVPAASAKTILYGNFSEAYLIRLVTGLQVLRLSERYADFLQTGFLAFQRADGTLQNAAAVRAYQHSAT